MMTLQLDRPLSWQACGSCGNEITETDPATRCRECGGLLEVRHRPPMMTREELLGRFAERRGESGVWRYREVVLPSADVIVSHPEGNTPLLHRSAVDRYAGIDGIRLKHEGHNPTGSFKDRGMTVGVTQAVRTGARAVACASTGNTAASLAAYAAQARIPACVFLPARGVAESKLAQARAYGARLIFVRGDFDDCLRLVEEAGERLGLYVLNSVNPFRLEGQKTIVFELLQQLDWNPPEWLVVPAGNLGNLSAFGKALRELVSWGVIARMPRLVGVQAAGAAPFARAFADGFAARHTVRAETIASAIRIGNPASYDRAVRAIRETNGLVVSVTDDEIVAAKTVIDQCGAGCELASAATIAAVRNLVADGRIRDGERVVAVLTGHLLKEAAAPPFPGAASVAPPEEIEPTLGALEVLLGTAPRAGESGAPS